MVGDVRFNDLVRIYQIRSRPKKSKFQDRNKNFEEFTDVYKDILSDNSPESSRLKPCFVPPSRSRYGEIYSKKPLHNIKKIHLEMPMLGAERAIVTTPTGSERKPPKKKVEKKEKSLVMEGKSIKSDQKETEKPKGNKEGLLNETELLLKQTKQEIGESAAQLEAIKTLINQIKPPERIRKSRSPTYKAKKKSDRHTECISKKYVSTLNTMQEKLKKLEEKYFSKPHIIYKNVRDICTTSSDIDILYENSSSLGNEDINETIQGIKQELDFIANSGLDKEEKKPKKTVTFKAPEVEFNTVGDTFDEDKNICPSNFSFKKPVNFDDDITGQDQENYSKIIDQSENWFKKYFTKHFDIEQFCQDVHNLVEDEKPQVTGETPEDPPKVEEADKSITTDESDKESNDSEVDHFYHRDKSVFFDRELQAVISSSSYLSKEFDRARPSVKVFINTDNYLRGKYFGVPSKTNSSLEPSITDLIDNLSMSLKGSIYYKANAE